MRALLWLSLVALLVTAVAGCIGGGSDEEQDPVEDDGGDTWDVVTPEAPAFDWSSVVDPDHGGHSVPGLHMVGHGLDQVGYTPIQDILPTQVRGSITQVDVQGDWAVVSGMEGGLAFAIVDISDPARPTPVSWYPSSADGWTARWSDDTNYVFYGCQRLEGFNPYALTGGTCDDPRAVGAGPQKPSGVVVVDTSDKADPTFIDFIPTGGSHNLVHANISGVDYIFTNAVDIVKFDREAQKLEVVANLPGQHDSSVAWHPVTKEWLMFTGTGQLSIYNVDDPADPQLVYEGDGSGGWTGWHEQTMVPGVVDGRVVLVLAGESFAGTGAAQQGDGSSIPDILSIVNITDPAAPELLGRWKPPFDPQVPWASYLYSIHEVATTPTGQVAVAWYHAGAWVLDVSTKERQENPVILAAFQPHEEITATPATFAQTPLPYVPFVWGAGWKADGHLVVPDMHTGLYILQPAWGLHEGLDGGQ